MLLGEERPLACDRGGARDTRGGVCAVFWDVDIDVANPFFLREYFKSTTAPAPCAACAPSACVSLPACARNRSISLDLSRSLDCLSIISRLTLDLSIDT